MPIGGEAVQLTDDPAPDWAPGWSPDETKLAFYSFPNRRPRVRDARGRRNTDAADVQPGLDAGPQW